MIKNHVKQGHGRKGKVRKKGIGRRGSIAWGACFVLSGIHMGLNSGWQSVWCFPIFHYQAASPAVGHYLLMTEWTADLMDRWMGSLMNAWQVLCQSGRQSKTQGEGRNHLDSRDTTQNPTCPHRSRTPHLQSNYSRILGVNEAAFTMFLSPIMAGYVAPISAGSNLEKCP